MMLSIYQPNSDVSLSACHRCDVPACINPDHLFWGTQSDNLNDASRKGRMTGYPRAIGVKHGMAKLNADQVQAIRISQESSKALSKKYGVSPSQVWRVRAGKVWSHQQ